MGRTEPFQSVQRSAVGAAAASWCSAPPELLATAALLSRSTADSSCIVTRQVLTAQHIAVSVPARRTRAQPRCVGGIVDRIARAVRSMTDPSSENSEVTQLDIWIAASREGSQPWERWVRARYSSTQVLRGTWRVLDPLRLGGERHFARSGPHSALRTWRPASGGTVYARILISP